MVYRSRNRGIVSVLAMLFIVVFSALAAAMAVVAQGNLRTAETYQRFNRALAAAETGMKFARFRVNRIARTVTTTHGEITPERADEHWATLRDKIIDEMSAELHTVEPMEVVRFIVLSRGWPLGAIQYNNNLRDFEPFGLETTGQKKATG